MAKTKLRKSKKKVSKSKRVSAKAKKVVKAKTSKTKTAKVSSGTKSFNISGCKPKLVRALDKAATLKSQKDGQRVSRSRLINSVLEKKFL